LVTLVSDVGLAWQALGCGNGVHLGVAAGAAGVFRGAAAGAVVSVLVFLAAEDVAGSFWTRHGLKVCGRVALPADSGVFGEYSGPFWPHAVNIAAPPTRACAVTRIFKTFNMHRL
jgi:hypothetical protein